jgi:two-component system sensor histidine kinase MprB
VSFRRRIAIASAAAVAIAVVLASVLIYLLTSHQLHNQVDNQLRNRGGETRRLLAALESVRGSGLSGGDVDASADQGASAAGRSASGTPRGGNGTRVAPLTIGQLPAGTLAKLGRGAAARGSGASKLLGRLPPSPGEVRGYQQVVDAHGRILGTSFQQVALPVDSATRALAANGKGTPTLRDARVKGIHLRVLAEPLAPGLAIQFAQPLTETDDLLSQLRLILVLIDLGGIALAALLGMLVAGAAVTPLRRLSEATEHVALTTDLSRRIEPSGDDELGRLAASFNAMLDALERSVSELDASVHAQRQLVADASHELRTPVTSLRTNIELLQHRDADMGAEERRRLLGDVVEQIEELTLLVNDLIELARGEEPRADNEEVRLDMLVEEVIERARRRAPGTPFHATLAPTLLWGVPARLERAVGNLIDNAVKYGPPGAPVEVTLADGELTVRDHGPGIAAADLPHVFDRFYRGAEARGRPGSGLGLAIVAQVAAGAGGSVRAEAAPGGGALMRVTLPSAEPVPEAPPAAARTGEAAPA